MMIEEKFKVIQFSKEFIMILDKELENFPRKEIEIKSKLKNVGFDLLEKLYEANTIEDDNMKKEILTKCIAKIKLLDFLINLSYEKKLIPEKKYIKLGNKLNDLIRYITGLLKKYLKEENK